ncbi:MAG TPA: cytochrome c biogenesis protein ResB [Desulfatiglandales bacterium]|nr:cytochrome c biogenesis protein ResB [Desulfatiglandales bacterium]
MKKTIFSFFSSIKLTIALFLIIAVASILGTLIPQRYGLDVYHSFWFITLMVLLSLNLIICSLNRFPTSWKLFKKTPSLDRTKPFENLPADRVLVIERQPREVIEKVEKDLARRLKRFGKKDEGNSAIFYGEQGAYSRFGVYIIHASILLVIAGAIIGSLLGFEAFVNLPEGESTNTVRLKAQNSIKTLDFTVRCDAFSISYYDNGMPKEYKSDLTFLKNNKVIHQGPLMVNQPITINGIRFYQASYGSIAGSQADVTIIKDNDQETAKTVKLDDPFFLEDNNTRVTIKRIEEDLMSMGPAVLVNIQSSEGNTDFWVFEHIDIIKEGFPGLFEKIPKFNPGLFKPYYFRLDSIERKYYTGLQISHDPGVPVVAAGSVFIILGFFITFFSSHRRFWVRVDDQEGKTRISVAASSDRDPVGLDREIRRMLRHFKKFSVLEA